MRAPLAAAIAASTLFLVASPAAACGGFFCNRQAIDQSGENILFVYNDDGTVTTVVQIQYTGPSESFAWILPVPAEPTVDVGTDTIFRELASRTRPRFDMEWETVGTCRSEPSCYHGFFDSDDDGLRGAGGEPARAADAGAGREDEVDVSFRGNVGPFDVAVIRSGSADLLRTWLTDNGYDLPEAAVGELDHYVALDHWFVALQLQKDRSSGEIQPIVLTSANDEPCIPLRLTRIATVPDMPIRAYFLGDRRARPLNFMLVEPDLDDEGLWTGATNYDAAVTQAVNDAGGHAFVTDYAGEVPDITLTLDSIEDLRTVTRPDDFLRILRMRGFTGDSQLLGILLRFIPPTEEYSADPMTFYNCLTQGWCAFDVDAYVDEHGFNPVGLVDALDEAIIQPRERAQEMLGSQPHLTRLYTTMSADEMDEDPMFMRSDELAAEYSNIHTAVRRTECGPEYFYWTAPTYLVMPSGREIEVQRGIPYRGTDAAYCDDRYMGGFHPGADEDSLREIARRRNLRAGGGAVCAARPVGSVGFGALGVLSLAALALAWRRRRAR